MKKVELGGKRLGSGSKMEVQMKNYERSTHNLSTIIRTSMTCGTLVPIYTNIMLNGDSWKINLREMVRTIPTIAPLYGSFKLQVDVFTAPVRLYQGLLHNNAVKVGLNMNKVYFPTINLKHRPNQSELDPKVQDGVAFTNRQINPSSLLKYLGVSGLGQKPTLAVNQEVARELFAVPILAYYDIFKNYYSNKQEDNAYVIGVRELELTNQESLSEISTIKFSVSYIDPTTGRRVDGGDDYRNSAAIGADGVLSNNIKLYDDGNIEIKGVYRGTDINDILIVLAGEESAQINEWFPEYKATFSNYGVNIALGKMSDVAYGYGGSDKYGKYVEVGKIGFATGGTANKGALTSIDMVKFPLDNIDKARVEILKKCQLGEKVSISKTDGVGEINFLPYSINADCTGDGRLKARYPMIGLCVKTYLSDIFNNWLNTEWIDGDNGVNQLTAIDTSSGSFTIDTLNLNQKIYNLLNRVILSGGTYEDWEEAVYDEEALRRAETPIYQGGASAEIVFEEVVSTAETNIEANKPLGTLAGKGTLANVKGGNIEIRCKETSIIMIIASITPRLDYSQGNMWYMTELKTMDDLHKPELDAIGFQNLMAEQMAWFSTSNSGNEESLGRVAVGKQPAWMAYMTDFNRCFGDFADPLKAMFMTLNRNYDVSKEKNDIGIYPIEDITTYIQPDKFNYAFADTTLEAQNFQCQFGIDIVARRKMSAKVIPNL